MWSKVSQPLNIITAYHSFPKTYLIQFSYIFLNSFNEMLPSLLVSTALIIWSTSSSCTGSGKLVRMNLISSEEIVPDPSGSNLNFQYEKLYQSNCMNLRKHSFVSFSLSCISLILLLIKVKNSSNSMTPLPSESTC